MLTQEGGSYCLFCDRTNHEKNKVIAENKTAWARWDNFPVSGGHLEVLPKRHVESFFELTAEEVSDIYALLGQVRFDIWEHYAAPDGFTIGINEGKAAGRTIDHLHIHLIPRRHGDVENPRGGVRAIIPQKGSY